MQRKLLLFAGLLLLILRFSLLGKGANAFGDEFRYWYSAQLLLHLSHGDLSEALAQLFRANARPGLVLANLPPVAMQGLWFQWTGLDPRSPDSLWIPQVYFVLLSVAQWYCFYRLALRWTTLPQRSALAVSLACALLGSSNFYLRHLLPYDLVLLCWLALLLHADTCKQAWRMGFWAGLIYLIYPGYWLLVPVSALVWCRVQCSERRRYLPELLRFGAGALFSLLLFEIAARFIGRSLLLESGEAGAEYLNYLQHYDGDFGLFLDYLYTLEGVPGLLIAAGSIAFLYLRARAKTSGALEWACGVLLAGFVLQAAIGWGSDLKVFYGRLFKMYLPFMTLAAGVFWLQWLPDYFYRLLPARTAKVGTYALWAALSLASVVHFVRFYHLFQSLEYPRDVLYSLGFACDPKGSQDYDIWMDTPPPDGLQRIQEYQPAGNYATIPPGRRASRPAATGRWILVNFTLLPCHLNGFYQPRELPPGMRRHWQGRHFMSWPAYWFEENLYGKRTYFKDAVLKMQVVIPE